ncbi:hypothetical protein [Vibrio harveyi]|uniref:hypothetical protein n=1 Tax=Vibrio harveyi TaxID=669 RepID=UPI00165D9997|nr:hypothetical protein [Vibrio harveyi]
MKIQLTEDLPIADEHGAKKGRVFDVVEIGGGRHTLYFFIGDAGEKCGAYASSECVVVKDEEK